MQYGKFWKDPPYPTVNLISYFFLLFLALFLLLLVLFCSPFFSSFTLFHFFFSFDVVSASKDFRLGILGLHKPRCKRCSMAKITSIVRKSEQEIRETERGRARRKEEREEMKGEDTEVLY